jgi:hypothetical protein
MREQDRVHALLQGRAVTDQVQAPARTLALAPQAGASTANSFMS